jgi:predicted XRE-type DNA-binding protein
MVKNGMISIPERGQKMKSAKKNAMVEESSGNVFADLGLPDPQGRLAKAQLAHWICQVIAARKITQAKAAEMMEMDELMISALMRGKLKGFSTDRLFRCLNDLGQEVEITIRPAPQAGRRGHIHVVAETI